MGETADELRVLVQRLRYQGDDGVTLCRDAADAIDGMLARLTAAEAERDEFLRLLLAQRDEGWEFDPAELAVIERAVALRDPS